MAHFMDASPGSGGDAELGTREVTSSSGGAGSAGAAEASLPDGESATARIIPRDEVALGSHEERPAARGVDVSEVDHDGSGRSTMGQPLARRLEGTLSAEFAAAGMTQPPGASYVFDAVKYADQDTFEDALVQYAKDRKQAGTLPPIWNLWQAEAYKIADYYPAEAKHHRGVGDWFSLLRDKTMGEVFGAGFRKLVSTAARRKVSRGPASGVRAFESEVDSRDRSAGDLVTPSRPASALSEVAATSESFHSMPEGLFPPPLPPVDAACFEVARAPGIGLLRARAEAATEALGDGCIISGVLDCGGYEGVLEAPCAPYP